MAGPGCYPHRDERGAGAAVPDPGHHHARALRRGRADRHRRASGGAVDVEAPRPDDRGREQAERRWHHRARTGEEREAGRLHDPDPPHRHGDHAGALPRTALQPADRLRLHRAHQRRADDDHRQARHGCEGLQGVPRLHQGEQGQGDLRERRHRRRVASLRHALHERDPDRLPHRALQGHGAGDERPPRRSSGFHVRPDDQHHRTDQGWQGQGLRRDLQDARGVSAGHPNARRAGPEGLRGRYLARPVRTEGDAEAGPRQAGRGAPGHREGRGREEALRRPRRDHHAAREGHAGCAAGAPQSRDRPVGAADQEGRARGFGAFLGHELRHAFDRIGLSRRARLPFPGRSGRRGGRRRPLEGFGLAPRLGDERGFPGRKFFFFHRPT